MAALCRAVELVYLLLHALPRVSGFGPVAVLHGVGDSYGNGSPILVCLPFPVSLPLRPSPRTASSAWAGALSARSALIHSRPRPLSQSAPGAKDFGLSARNSPRVVAPLYRAHRSPAAVPGFFEPVNAFGCESSKRQSSAPEIFWLGCSAGSCLAARFCAGVFGAHGSPRCSVRSGVPEVCELLASNFAVGLPALATGFGGFDACRRALLSQLHSK